MSVHLRRRRRIHAWMAYCAVPRAANAWRYDAGLKLFEGQRDAGRAASASAPPEGGQPTRAEPTDAAPRGKRRVRLSRRYWPDALIVGALLVAAYLSRRHGLPTDGLWLDDADPGAAMKVPL